MLKILVDEDTPRPTARLLQSLGIDAIDLWATICHSQR